MKTALPETRGRKARKSFSIKPGELKKFPIKDGPGLRYRARAAKWVISTRTINGQLLVFRES